MQKIIIMCYVELGEIFQTIYILQKDGSQTIKNIPLPQLTSHILELCDALETNNVQLFGIEEYLKELKYELILKNKNLKIGVNNHEIFN